MEYTRKRSQALVGGGGWKREAAYLIVLQMYFPFIHVGSERYEKWNEKEKSKCMLYKDDGDGKDDDDDVECWYTSRKSSKIHESASVAMVVVREEILMGLDLAEKVQ